MAELHSELTVEVALALPHHRSSTAFPHLELPCPNELLIQFSRKVLVPSH